MTRVIAAVVLAGAVASAQASLLQRQTGVSAVLQNSPKLYDGSYAGTGVSRMCGEVDPSQSFAPAGVFTPRPGAPPAASATQRSGSNSRRFGSPAQDRRFRCRSLRHDAAKGDKRGLKAHQTVPIGPRDGRILSDCWAATSFLEAHLQRRDPWVRNDPRDGNSSKAAPR